MIDTLITLAQIGVWVFAFIGCGVLIFALLAICAGR